MHIINIYMLLPFRPFGNHFSILGLWVLSDAYWVKIRLQRLTAAGRDRLSDTIRHKDQPEICWKSNVHLFWWKQSSEKHLLNWISVKWEKLHTRFLQDNMAKIQPSIYFQVAPFINIFWWKKGMLHLLPINKEKVLILGENEEWKSRECFCWYNRTKCNNGSGTRMGN